MTQWPANAPWQSQWARRKIQIMKQNNATSQNRKRPITLKAHVGLNT